VIVTFSEYPGRHERHFRRKVGNPLFPEPVQNPKNDQIWEVQRRDHEELIAFMSRLRDLVQRAVDLKPNEESQVVLDLKTGLDKAYEEACSLAEDQTGNKEAIRQLIAVITSTIRRSAAGDPLAARELDDEDEARQLHFRLLEQPLVADLLAPDSPIGPGELVPTLLSESAPAVRAALELFDQVQLDELCRDARELLAACGPLPAQVADAPARLAFMEQRLAGLSGHAQAN